MSDKASSQEEQSEEIYEVELIEKKKIETDGKAWYYIKWKDYPAEDNTWEPSENLECQEIIDDFEKRSASEPDLIEDKRSKRKRKEDEAKAAVNKPVPAAITKASSKKKEPTQPKKSASSSKRTSSQAASNGQRYSGFDEGLTAETIIGATDSSGTLMYLIKWKERNEASLVDSKLANQKCPQVVIQYLSQKITFVNDNDSEN